MDQPRDTDSGAAAPRAHTMGRREPSTTGLAAHIAASIAYLAGPVSGVLVLMAERTNSYVRFHAWQAVVGLGGLGLIVAALLAVAFASVIVSAAAFRALIVTAWIAWALWIVCWAICLFKAFTRRRWKLPVAGALAERLTARSGPTSSL